MQPEVQRLLEISQGVEQAMNTPSQNDATFRAMLHELTHQDDVERFVREQVGGIPELATSLSGRVETLTRELADARARIAGLEAENATLKATPSTPPMVLAAVSDEYPEDAISGTSPVDDIPGYKRPSPLHAVDNNAAV